MLQTLLSIFGTIKKKNSEYDPIETDSYSAGHHGAHLDPQHLAGRSEFQASLIICTVKQQSASNLRKSCMSGSCPGTPVRTRVLRVDLSSSPNLALVGP